MPILLLVIGLLIFLGFAISVCSDDGSGLVVAGVFFTAVILICVAWAWHVERVCANVQRELGGITKECQLYLPKDANDD